MKIKQMLYIVLLVFTLLPLYIFGTIMIHENNVKVENILSEDLNAISGSQILDINDFCENRNQEMTKISEYSIVKNSILASLGEKPAGSQSDFEYTEDILSSLIRNNPSIESVCIIDRNYKIVNSTAKQDRQVFSELNSIDSKYLTGKFFIGNVYERETDDGTKKLIPAVLGITHNNDLIGYIIEEIPTSYFDRYRSNTNLWKNGTFYLLDGNNVLITAGTPNEQSRTQLKTSEKDRENFQNAWNAIDHEQFPSGSLSYTMGGDEYLTYYSNISYTDWGIRLTVNLSEYKEVTALYKKLIIIMIVCLTLLLLIINYILTQRLTRPINNIAETLKRIQNEQNYSIRVKNPGKDEMGYLAQKTNELLDILNRNAIIQS